MPGALISEPAHSVVLPAFNAEATIRSAVESVLRQSNPSFELIVVDDGSTDGTRNVLAELASDPRVRVVQQPNRGAAAARNSAIAIARGHAISFIDSDDLWLPTFLEEMGTSLAASGDIGLVYTDAWTIDPSTRKVGAASAMHWQRPPVPPPVAPAAFLRELLRRNFVYTATMVPASVLARVGPFRESLGAAIDYEMWLRIVASGYRAVRSARCLAIYTRGRAGSISSDRERVIASLVEVYGLAASTYPIDESLRALARSRRQEMLRELEALRGRGRIDGLWRRRMRPALVRARNMATKRDGLLAHPPDEIAAAFPDLIRDRLGPHRT